jgi:phosphoserine phosphatase
MLTFYCPSCWKKTSSDLTICPECGYDLSDFSSLSYEEKLLRALHHPVPASRMVAIQTLGELHCQLALSELEKTLKNLQEDVYTLREIVIAIAKIPGEDSRVLLKEAARHLYALVRHKAEELLNRWQMTRIILVRHGQTDWNLDDRFRGRADVPLNATGVAQAQATGQRVAEEWQPVAIYSSSLSRALDTGQAIADHLARSYQTNIPVQVISDLADFDFGKWEGLTPEEARQHWPEEIEAWYASPQTVHIPGGETLQDLRERAMKVIRDLVSQHSGETIAVVSHTDVNRIILLDMLGLRDDSFWRLRQDTCAINVIEAEDGSFTIVTINDTCHLRHIR